MVIAVDGTREPNEGPARRWSKPLGPMALACLGSLLCGVAVAASAGLTTSDPRSVRGILLWFAVGVVLGLLLFVPAAVLVRYREPLARRLRPHANHIERIVSLIMANALGYWLGSTLHAAPAWISILAFVLVGLGAFAKVGLSIVFEKR
jgi:hypothetical protein